jgi:hypothetical protein
MAPPPPSVAETIRRKKAQYGHIVDTKTWDLLPTIILPNANMVFLEPNGQPTKVGKRVNVFDSRDAYRAQIGKFLEGGQTHHLFGYGELEMTGPVEVTAVFSMRDTFVLDGAGGLIWSDGGGYYYEKWVKEGEDWFMADLRLERINVRKSFLFSVADSVVKAAAWVGIDLSP